MVNGVERYLPNVSHGDLLGEPGNLDTTLRQPDPASSRSARPRLDHRAAHAACVCEFDTHPITPAKGEPR